MRKKQIANNLLFNFLSLLIGLCVTFIVTPYIIKNLGLSAYGFFPMATNITSYANLVVVAMNSIIARYITIAFHKGELKKAERYFNTSLILYYGLALFLLITSILFIIYLDKIHL